MSIQNSTNPQAQFISVELAYPDEKKNTMRYNYDTDFEKCKRANISNIYIRKEALIQAFGEIPGEIEVIVRRKRT